MTKWTVIKVHAVVENFCILLNIVFWSLNQQEQLGANKKDLIKSNSWSNSMKVLCIFFSSYFIEWIDNRRKASMQKWLYFFSLSMLRIRSTNIRKFQQHSNDNGKLAVSSATIS